MIRSYCLLFVLAVVATSGCVTEGAYQARAHRSYSLPMNSVGFAQRGLSRAFAVENYGGTRTASDRLEVFVDLRNRTGGPIAVSARTRFFDANQQPLEVTAWTRLFAEPRSTSSYRTSATHAGASQFYVEVQEGH